MSIDLVLKKASYREMKEWSRAQSKNNHETHVKIEKMRFSFFLVTMAIEYTWNALFVFWVCILCMHVNICRSKHTPKRIH